MTVIKHTFFCDYAGCNVSTPSLETHAPVMPADWSLVSFSGRTDKNESTQAECHLCPEHSVVVGKQLGNGWSVSTKMVKAAPKRFA